MKKIFLNFSLLSLFVTMGTDGWAQRQIVASRGDTVTLEIPEGYNRGQWQVSYDLKHFVDLPGRNQNHLSLIAHAPNYYRAKVNGKSGASSYLDTVQVVMKPVDYAPNYSVTGGAHGYIESRSGDLDVRGIDVPYDANGHASSYLTNWKDGNVMVVYYIHTPKDTIDTEMWLTVRKGKKVAFRMSMWDPQDLSKPLSENYTAFVGDGTEQSISMMGMVMPRKDYFRVQLECLEGCQDIERISKYHHYSPTAEKIGKARYLGSPSVHLAYSSTQPGASSAPVHDWCYHEVMLPKSSDLPATYVMSLGVLDGYMGIQNNGWKDGKPRHEVLFSMWDNGDTEKDPNLPENLRANVLDFGKDVEARRFGGEGTGMQTGMHGYRWDAGTYVQFLVNSRLETVTYTEIRNGKEVVRKQRNTLVSAWFNAQDGKGWQYMATLRLPKKSLFFKNWYSFLENYSHTTGHALRTAYYRNGFARNKNSKKWYHFNKTSFTHTDGSNDDWARHDYGQGASDQEKGAFFMCNGGYLPPCLKAKEVPLANDLTPVDTIDLEALEARVDLAVQREAERVEEENAFQQHLLDKSLWKMMDFSSEERSSEGDYGRAYQIMDGDVNSYWHPSWSVHVAHCPHWFEIDLGATYELSHFQLLTSGGESRMIKSLSLFVKTEENDEWRLSYTDEELPKQHEHRIRLPKKVEGRFVKVQVNASYANGGIFARINEIDFAGVPMLTGIEAIGGACAAGQIGKAPFRFSCDRGILKVMNLRRLPVQISLFNLKGECVFSCDDDGQREDLTLTGLMRGPYVMSLETEGKRFAQSFVWGGM